MRDLHNALADTLERFQPQLNWRILPDADIANRWRIQVWSQDDSLLEVEILDLEGTPVGCVLQRKHIPLRTMRRFMDTLLDALDEDDGRRPPGGSPVA
jgi:hypothetical protein